MTLAKTAPVAAPVARGRPGRTATVCGSTGRGWGRWTRWRRGRSRASPSRKQDARAFPPGPGSCSAPPVLIALVLGASCTRESTVASSGRLRAPDVILTVTLNAAIDRTVAVPNFRLGQRHRAVESRTVAGGKGVNVARALKLLGRPVIATGLVGGSAGHADRRAPRRGVDPQRLHADRGRVAHQPRGRRSDHRRADRDQRARPAGDARRGRPLRREAPLPRAGRDDLRPRRVDPAGLRPGRLRAARHRAQGART